jgi:hypothetical protein
MAEEGAEIVNAAGDGNVTEFRTYEEYLDSQITPIDLFYLEVCDSDTGQGIGKTASGTGIQRQWRAAQKRRIRVQEEGRRELSNLKTNIDERAGVNWKGLEWISISYGSGRTGGS